MQQTQAPNCSPVICIRLMWEHWYWQGHILLELKLQRCTENLCFGVGFFSPLKKTVHEWLPSVILFIMTNISYISTYYGRTTQNMNVCHVKFWHLVSCCVQFGLLHWSFIILLLNSSMESWQNTLMIKSRKNSKCVKRYRMNVWVGCIHHSVHVWRACHCTVWW